MVDSAGAGVGLELVEPVEYGFRVEPLGGLTAEPTGLVAFVVDLRESADIAAVLLDLVQVLRCEDGAGELVAVESFVEVGLVHDGSLVGERDW